MMQTPKTLFTPIKNKRFFEEVSTEIKRLILNGTLKPGDKLPSEIELARQFHVGRQTVREGLRLLELSGFITVQKGSTGGPLIQNTILNRISSSFLDAIQMKEMAITELTVARLEIEKLVLNHVFDSVLSTDIEDIQDNILKAKKKIENNIPAFDENIQFHKLLAKASNNHIFVIVTESIMAVVAHFLAGHETDLERSNNVLQYHEAILNAIREGKRDEAITLLGDHILEVQRVFAKAP